MKDTMNTLWELFCEISDYEGWTHRDAAHRNPEFSEDIAVIHLLASLQWCNLWLTGSCCLPKL